MSSTDYSPPLGDFQPADAPNDAPDADDLVYRVLSTLAGIDTHDVDLRDHPAAHDAADKLLSFGYASGRADEQADTAPRMQRLVDALAKTETYLQERLAATNGTGATKILPMIRAALEGAEVAPTQTSWSDV